MNKTLMLFYAVLVVLSMTLPARAGPGAHGPGGEHLDQSANATGKATQQPRFEAATELFELVARLVDGELSILIDRFDTNEPVLKARVEVESSGVKAVAKFHDDHGDYAVDDAKLLALFAKQGEHAVVISVVAGENSDLLNGTLVVADPKARVAGAAHDHGQGNHGHGLDLAHAIEYAAIGAGLALILFFGWRMWRRRAAARMTQVRL